MPAFHADLAAAIADLGLTVDATFIPFSQSRNKGKKTPSLNWRVTIRHNGRDVLETDYSAGAAHAPSYRQTFGRRTMEDQIRERSVAHECENGRAYSAVARRGVPIMPDPVDVIWSLTQDAGAIDHAAFEDWAGDYGYDTDSRSAEATYRQCLAIATRLRAAIGEAGLTRLRDAGADY